MACIFPMCHVSNSKRYFPSPGFLKPLLSAPLSLLGPNRRLEHSEEHPLPLALYRLSWLSSAALSLLGPNRLDASTRSTSLRMIHVAGSLNAV